MGSRPQRDSFLSGEGDRSLDFRVPGREIGDDDDGGMSGRKRESHPASKGSLPQALERKGFKCVCSVMPSREDLRSLDLHTGSGTNGLRKSGRGIRWKALEEREAPGLGALIFSLPQPPPWRGVEGGGWALAASRIERPRLFWESSFLPCLLQPPQPRSLESAGSSQ